MKKHTPGPWEVNEDNGIVFSQNKDGGTCVAVFEDVPKTRPFWEDGEGQIKANARLIAAAPDLLAAAILARGSLLSIEPGYAELTAAINKATL